MNAGELMTKNKRRLTDGRRKRQGVEGGGSEIIAETIAERGLCENW